MKKVLCIGHTTYDTFLIVDNAEVHCNIDTRKCEVCFGFGNKIPVRRTVYSIGGGAANVSAGLATLGIDVALYTYIGNDPYGEFVKGELKDHNVALNHVKVDNKPTDLATIVSYKEDRTIFTYNHDRDFDYPDDLDTYDMVFVSSIGAKVDVVYEAVKNYKSLKPNNLVVFSPGSKELADGINLVRDFARHCDVFISNVEEGVRVYAPDTERSDHLLVDVLLDFQRQFSPVVVFTDGAKGVYIGEKGLHHHLESIPVKVVEKTGAGDAFASGFIAGNILGLSNIDSAKWGITNSISMIQHYGAHEGLLNRDNLSAEVERFWPN